MPPSRCKQFSRLRRRSALSIPAPVTLSRLHRSFLSLPSHITSLLYLLHLPRPSQPPSSLSSHRPHFPTATHTLPRAWAAWLLSMPRSPSSLPFSRSLRCFPLPSGPAVMQRYTPALPAHPAARANDPTGAAAHAAVHTPAVSLSTAPTSPGAPPPNLTSRGTSPPNPTPAATPAASHSPPHLTNPTEPHGTSAPRRLQRTASSESAPLNLFNPPIHTPPQPAYSHP